MLRLRNLFVSYVTGLVVVATYAAPAMAQPLPAGAAPAVRATSVWTAEASASAIAAGRGVLLRHECNRCHTIDNLPPASRPRDCTGCHDFLKGLSKDDPRAQQIDARYGAGVLQSYQKNITHLLVVPDLSRIAARIRPDWIAGYLAAPYDVRPLLAESMIRHRLSAAEIRAVTRYFAAVADVPDPYAANPLTKTASAPIGPARIAAGGKLFRERGCTSCHTLGNVDTGTNAAALAGVGLSAALAPNLRFARERMKPDVIVEWILNPAQLAPRTRMPNMGLDRAQAELVRDYLLGVDPQLLPTPRVNGLDGPKLLNRPVSYAEMKEKVLGKVCVHCHMNAYEKDTGPGNQGGLGYAGIGLMMRTYEALVSGARGADGKRYSVLQPRAGEKVAPILQAMLRRKQEAHRDQVPPSADFPRPAYPAGKPGMPLGLPAMSDEEMSILATWIAQGCQGPSAVTGIAGINDGLFVPDGPISKNAGCEIRPPARKRPQWAVDQ